MPVEQIVNIWSAMCKRTSIPLEHIKNTSPPLTQKQYKNPLEHVNKFKLPHDDLYIHDLYYCMGAFVHTCTLHTFSSYV